MNAENDRIYNLIGELSEAFWERVRQPGVSPLDELAESQQHGHVPKSEREIAIWNQLTSPENLDDLRNYVKHKAHSPPGINEYARKLHEHLLADAEARAVNDE